MFQLNYRDTRPIYEQIKDNLRKMIISGAFKVNEKLPSVRILATQMSINPNTIQRAYNELEKEGYVYSIPGKGSFVCPRGNEEDEHVRELKKRLEDTANELRYLGVSEADILASLGGR